MSRVVLFAYHDVGCACLRALLDSGAEVVLVVTHENDPGENVWFGSVRAIAEEHRIPVAVPDDVNDPSFVARVRALAPDVLVSAYFRRILGPELLAITGRGAFNMHGSLLPRYRGRAPVNWVLVEGESVTGVTLHVMDTKPDRGDIVGQREIPITDDDTARTLHAKSAAAAGDLLRELWPRIEAGTFTRTPQDPKKASYRGRRGPEDGRIDFTRPARACWNLVRAVTHPYPGAFTLLGGRKLHVWKASLARAQGTVTPGPVTDAPGRGTGAPGRVTSTPASAAVVPGRIAAVVPGRGVVVTAGDGEALMLERVQFDGDVERDAADLGASGALTVGQVLGR